VRSVLVVSVLLVVTHATYLIEDDGQIAVKYLGAEGAVESFDVSVLGRLTRLDVHQFDSLAANRAGCGGNKLSRP